MVRKLELSHSALLLLVACLLLAPPNSLAQGPDTTSPATVPPPDLDPTEYLSFIWYEMTGEWLQFSLVSADQTASQQWQGPTRYWIVRDERGNLHVVYVGDYNALFLRNTELAEGVVLDDMWGSIGNSINAYWCLLTGLCGDAPPDWPNWVWMPEVEASYLLVPPYGQSPPAVDGGASPTQPPAPSDKPATGPVPGIPTEDPNVHIHFGSDVVNPVVAGQDPDSRGADIFVTVQVPPVIYNYELEQREQRCIRSDTPPPDWNGCDLDTDGDGSADHPDDPHWNEDTASSWVPQHLAVPDQVLLSDGRWTFRAILSEESRAWILGELRAHYPHAVVVHPDWDLSRTQYFELTDHYIDGDLQAIVRMQATYVPFIDPGVYELLAIFRTTGTAFQCPGVCRNVRVNLAGRTIQATRTQPRLLEARRDLKVWMHDARLVQ